MSYQDELEYLYSLHQFGIKLGLSNIRNLCALSGNPHERIKTVHVGGTNGKGSTAAILSAILQEAGYKTGLYTSPHLTDFTERIRINNIPIPKERAAGLVRSIRECVGDRDITPTFFELTTALALSYFAEETVDIAIMEVGMGGRLDATNIINPLVSVITHVGYDHMEHLGASLEQIAMEKCGIIKRGVPVITSESKGEILSIIGENARESDAPLHVFGREFHAEPVRMAPSFSEFCYHGLQWERLQLRTPLAGRHQMFNMGSALCASELLTGMGFYITEREAADGVRNVSWPGRLEMVSDRPQIFLDGAHNPDGAVALRRFIEDVLMAQSDHRKIILIFGVLKDKDAGAMIRELIPCSTEVIITSPNTERGLPVEALREIVEKQGVKPYVTQTISGALSLAHDIASSSDTIMVTGSLYVVGEARALIAARPVSG